MGCASANGIPRTIRDAEKTTARASTGASLEVARERKTAIRRATRLTGRRVTETLRP